MWEKKFENIYSSSVRYPRIEEPKPDAKRRVFSLEKKYYCRGSTLSNTRFANNELSSINC